jgi:hypothetical protein
MMVDSISSCTVTSLCIDALHYSLIEHDLEFSFISTRQSVWVCEKRDVVLLGHVSDIVYGQRFSTTESLFPFKSASLNSLHLPVFAEPDYIIAERTKRLD